jgi:hypothetical protein
MINFVVLFKLFSVCFGHTHRIQNRFFQVLGSGSKWYSAEGQGKSENSSGSQNSWTFSNFSCFTCFIPTKVSGSHYRS